MKNHIAEVLARLPKLHRAANKSSTISDLHDSDSPLLSELGHAYVDAAREEPPPAAGGRPPGSGRFPNSAALRARIDPLVALLKATGKRPTEDQVCQILDDGGTDPRVLRRWIADPKLLGMTWEEYISTVPPAP